jgi:hypothetical protein
MAKVLKRLKEPDEMSKDITVSDDLYRRLHDRAARQGQTIESYLDRLTTSSAADDSEVLRGLRAKGLLVTWPDATTEITDHPPVVVRGAPLSRTIIEDRR